MSFCTCIFLMIIFGIHLIMNIFLIQKAASAGGALFIMCLFLFLYSLIAFIVIYFAVFGAGVGYLFKLMGKTPERAPYEEDVDYGPLRASGIVPGVQQEAPKGGHYQKPAE